MSVELKEPSQKIRLMVSNCASNLTEFAKSWEELKLHGMEEGFTEKELQSMVVTAVRKELEERGYSGKQLSNKLFYMFNKEEQIERVKKNNDLKFKSDYHNNDIEQSSSTLSQLQKENSEMKDVIANMSFGDNPNVFQISKQDTDNTQYFENLTPIEAATIIKESVDANKRVEIGWRILE